MPSNIAHGGSLAFDQQSGSSFLDYNNNGIITAKDAEGELGGSITSTSGTGEVIIDTHGTIQFDTTVSGNTINFVDGTGVLIIEQLGAIASSVKITGLVAGDTIQLPNLPTGFLENYNTTTGALVISDAGGTPLGTLTFAGSPLPSDATVVDAVVQCFVAATRIATPAGHARVETLKVGDRVLLLDGGSGTIDWVGQRHVDCKHHSSPEKVRPFRIEAHAFRQGVPHRDLLLSPDHAIFMDGVLVPVKYLENGETIRQLKVSSVTYHHFELREHAIVMAEGLTVETLLPGSNKEAFARGSSVTALYPDFSLLNWEALGYAPLVVFGPQLNAIRCSLDRRAAAIRAQRSHRAA